MRGIGVVLGLALVLAAAPAGAQDSITKPGPFPILPCAGEASPSYPDIGDMPVVRVWRDEEIRGWRRPNCAGLGPLVPNALIAVTGRFRAAGGLDAIAGRIAAISQLTSIRYFSIKAGKWQPLFVESHALVDLASNGPPSAQRPDFRADDLQTGRQLRYWLEENSLLSGVTYRLTVQERSPDRMTYTIINETAAKALLLTASEPGEFRQVYEIEHEAGDVWRYYSLVEARMRMGPFNLSTRSFQNRAIAYYRYIAGYPTEAEIRLAP